MKFIDYSLQKGGISRSHVCIIYYILLVIVVVVVNCLYFTIILLVDGTFQSRIMHLKNKRYKWDVGEFKIIEYSSFSVFNCVKIDPDDPANKSKLISSPKSKKR